MARFRFGPVVAAMAGLMVISLGGAVPAQNPQGKDTPKAKAKDDDPNNDRWVKVPITTADDADLEGTYYRGTKGAESPCIMLLHRWGSDRSKGDWHNLALKLQDKGFAVLSFDFRGHGAGTRVGEHFWEHGFNVAGIKGTGSGKAKRTVSFKELKTSYLPVLVNDVVAARRFLDTKHEHRDCNTGTLILIGADEGADLGLMFTAYEWDRQIVIGANPVSGLGGTNRYAGADIAAGIWLNLKTRGQATTFPIADWFRSRSSLRDSTPMCFIFSEQDPTARADAQHLFDVVSRPPDGRRDKHKLDAKVAVKTRLSGEQLLAQSGLKVTDTILEYVDKVMKDRKAVPWRELRLNEQTPVTVLLSRYGVGVP